MSFVPVPGLSGFSLYVGDKADAKDLAQLRQRGVRYVINCTPSR